MSALAEALVAAQAEMPAVEPNQENPHFKSKFVSLDHLIAKTRPVLNRHGLALVQLPATGELGQPVLRTILIHGVSGEQISADTPLILGKNDMQGFGAAITYARRYAWSAALGIAADEDQDGNVPQGSVAGEPAAAAATGKPLPETPFSEEGENAVVDYASESKRKKLDLLIRKLRDQGRDPTGWIHARERRAAATVPPSEDGLVHWGGPTGLRDRLTNQEAAALIETLEGFLIRVEQEVAPT